MAKPKTARAASLKKHRDRKKAEMQSLRDQVAALEAQLAHLRLVARPQLKPCDTSQPLPLAVLPFLLDARSQLQEAAAAGMSWADIAAAQASERFRSEALNQTLRDALQRQAQMSDAVRGVLGSSEALSEDMASLLGLQKHESLNTLGAAPQTVLMQQLYANLQQMYGATASVIGPQSEADWTGAASCTTREKERDALGSKCIEIRTTSQLFCSFAEVGRLMWQRTIRMQSSSSPNDPSEYMMEKRLVTGSSFMKTFRIPLETPSVAHTADLVGTSYMHKFDEPGRHLCLWTSTISLPALGAEFREQGWILAAPCRQPPGSVDASDTGPSTVLKMCYQVSHVSDGLEASTAQSRAVADAVLKLLSRRTREHLQIMQNTLLDEYLPFQRPPRASQP